MIVPDTNLLIYAYDKTSPAHTKARQWWEGTLNGDEPIGIPWVVLLAFTRLLTHPTICSEPLAIASVRSIVEQWQSCPHLRFLNPSENAPSVFFDLLEEAAHGGNLTTDALIALHAREHSATIYTNDRDFSRFKGIKTVNPIM